MSERQDSTYDRDDSMSDRDDSTSDRGDSGSEGHERQQAPETGDEYASETTRQAQTGQGQSPAQGTPSIGGDDQRSGQTQTPAEDDDVGVPDDPGADKD